MKDEYDFSEGKRGRVIPRKDKMKPYEITNPINATETECGLTIYDWMARERDRINKDPKREVWVRKGKTKKGHLTWQLVDNAPPPMIAGSHTTRIDAQNKAFKEGRETPLTGRRVY